MLQKELAKRLKARYDTKMDGSGWLEVSSDGIPLCRIKHNGQFQMLCFIRAEYNGKTEFLYLPCEEEAIDKAFARLGTTADEVKITLEDFTTDSPDWFGRFREIASEEGVWTIPPYSTSCVTPCGTFCPHSNTTNGDDGNETAEKEKRPLGAGFARYQNLYEIRSFYQ